MDIVCVHCTEGCACDLGYVKDENDNCIEEAKCCTRPHQEYNPCGTHCIDRCSANETIIHTDICNKMCNNNCFCEKGYIMNHNDECIPVSECKPEN